MTSVHDIAIAAAEHLPGWRVEAARSVDWNCDLVQTDGEGRLFFGEVTRENRLQISWMLTHITDSKGQALSVYSQQKSIGVSRDRHPKEIAKEIERRLLPGYAERLAKVLEWRDTSNAKLKVDAAIIIELEGLLGEEAQGNRLHVYQQGGCSFDIAVSGGEVEIALRRLTAAQAKAVVTAVRSAAERLPIDELKET